MPRAPYQTKQKAAVLECLHKSGGAHLTIPQIAAQLTAADCAVSIPTIYRYLDTFTAQQALSGNARRCWDHRK